MDRLTKFYDDQLSERRYRAALAIAVIIALVGMCIYAVSAGKPELAEKIINGILPTGAFALGGLLGGGKKQSPTPTTEAPGDA